MISVTDIDGIGPSTADALEEKDYESVEDIAQGDPDDISEINGVTEDRALEFIISAGNLLDEEDDEFDLTPQELSDESDETNESDESDDGEIEDETEDRTGPYTIEISFDTDEEYHTFHAAVMRYHEKVYTSEQPAADVLKKVLDELTNSEDITLELEEFEINTLHTAVKQARTDYQGDSNISRMEALAAVEDIIDKQRRDYLL